MEESTIIPGDRQTEPGRRSSRSDGELQRGAVLGRYVVLERLGVGGMGAVYAAFDPQLDRRVALKVLHAEVARRDQTGTARLTREAQAMAKLSHANVVTVHDAGLADGRFFIAMELVEGQTFKAWLKQAKRSRDDVLRTLGAAGRGLAAAHAQGLVHRDFKPDNVMVASDGRVMVMDFGLARGSEHSSLSGSASLSATELSGSLSSEELTQTGTLLGTPAYMSPEQFSGELADERSDQFSFCVTAWEALYGQRPFWGDSLATLAQAVRKGEMREPPKSVRLPGRLRNALRIGLTNDPLARHDSMTALLARLTPHSPRRNQTLVAAGVAGGTALLVVGAAIPGDDTTETCSGAAQRVGQRWDDTRAATLAEAFERTKVPFAQSAWEQVQPRLAEFFSTWRDAHVTVCRATHVLGEQSQSRLDLRMDCLDESLRHADAVLDELNRVDADLLTNVGGMVAQLPSPSACINAVRSSEPLTDRSDVERTAVASARTWRATTNVRINAGRWESAIEAANTGLDAVRGIEAAEVSGDLLAYRAKAEQGLGRTDDAMATLGEGLRIAQRAGQARTEADLWLTMIHIVGAQQKQTERGLALQLPARLAVERTDEPLMRVKLEATAGHILAEDGRPDEALPHFEEALAVAAKAEIPERELGTTRNNYGLVLFDLSRWDDALEQQQRTHDAELLLYGHEHPLIATNLANFGRIHAAKGDVATAREFYERSIELRKQLAGPDDSSVGDTLMNLALLNSSVGELETAREQLTTVRSIYLRALGPTHPYMGVVELNLGTVALSDRRLEDALQHNQRAQQLLAAHYGPEHPRALSPLGNSAVILADMERFDEARPLYERSIELLTKAHGPDHKRLSYPLMGLAQTLIGLNLNAESVAPAKRALELRQRAKVDPRLIAETVFVLALAEWAAADNRERALQLARQAADMTRPGGPAESPLYPQIHEWIVERTQD